MNIFKIIPNNDKWIHSGNIVYINYYVKVPILQKMGSEIWVYFDKKIAKYVIQLVKLLNKNNIDFLFKSTAIVHEHKFTEHEFHLANLKQYLLNISQECFFDGFAKINFDFTSNLAMYLQKYKCYDIFKEAYEKTSKIILSQDFDWFSGRRHFVTKREDIREYISGLQREIKINLLI